MNDLVNLEVEKNKFLRVSKEKAIEIATEEYFKNNIVKINNKQFDIFDFGDYREKILIDFE